MKHRGNIHGGPPRWMQKLLHTFASEYTLEEVDGDLLELYDQWTAVHGRSYANTRYLFTVITLLRPFRNRRTRNAATITTMIKSYLTMSWRSIVRNKVSSSINLAGLTLGLTTSLLILLVVLDEFAYDRHHVKKENLFLMMRHQKTNEGIITSRATAGPTAEALKAGFPQVVHAARVAPFHDTPALAGNEKSTLSGIYTDADIFEMMTFNTMSGDPAAALRQHAMVLTRSGAHRLFGTTDVVGKQLVVDGSKSFLVGAVIQDLPAATTVKFEAALPFQALEAGNEWLAKWDDNRIQTWVELHSPGELSAFNNTVATLVRAHTGDANETLFAYPLADLHLRGQFSNGNDSGGLITVLWILIGLGCFMLLVACINFMNIATAQSAYRAREVGVRKVLGARRRWIMFQFMHEALLITAMALVAAVVVTILVIPSFNTMMHTAITFDFDNIIVWVGCAGVALTTALVAGSYPALFLSRFSPVRVLKGVVEHGGSLFRRTLVTFQFVISILVLVGTIILFAQFEHVRSRPLGYDQTNLLHIPLDSTSAAKFDVITNELGKIPHVVSVTGMAGNILFADGSITGMEWPGKKPGEDVAVFIADTGYGWTETMKIEITSGRDFDSNFASDQRACLLNESAVRAMGLADPLGSMVGGHQVIGVFRDYLYNNPIASITPMAVFLRPGNINALYVRVDDAARIEVQDQIRTTLRHVSPGGAFEIKNTADEYAANFEEFADVGLMVSIFGGMTMFISCLGLFGLSGFVAEKRSREMSIRKVLGADHFRVLALLSMDILKPVLVALAIVIPVTVWGAANILQLMAYRVPLRWWMFGEAASLVVGVALVVIIYHSWKTAKENPAVRLKNE